MSFKELCLLFDSVKNEKKHNNKCILFRSYFKKCRQTLPRENLFPIIRLIVPTLDRERPAYNMKESRIAKVLTKMLCLPDGDDKNELSKSHLMSSKINDFGNIVHTIIRKYLTNCHTNLSIEELNSGLDQIADRSKETEAEEILLKLFRKCSAEDCQWIIRIILKELKLGLSTAKVLNSYHKDGDNFYSMNSNLKKLAETFYDENVNIHELNIEIFEAFRPMLSRRVDANIFKKDLNNNTLFYVENKFDGERFQLHMQNGEFRYFSRNGFNFTETFGATFDTEDGIFTSKLRNVFQPVVTSIILDGEMMLWNKHAGKYGSKGMELDVKKLNEHGKYQPCFCVFDIILLNRKVLTNRPYKDRINLLKRIFKQTIPGTIVLSEVRTVCSGQEILDELNRTADIEEEGIIVKNPESIYKYFDRNGGWYKLKMEYFQDTMTDLDLILMGGQVASIPSDKLNSFFVGIQSGVSATGQPIFVAFAKVSSGINDEELDMLNKKLKSSGKRFEEPLPSTLVFGKETPHYYIEPENSLVFVVRATELIRINDASFKTSYTLRFPRVIKIRDDKPADECLKINELMELTNKNQAVIKLNRRHITLEEVLQTRKRKVRRKAIEVLKFEDTRQISDIFEDYTFYVFNETSGDRSRDKVEALIKRAGGNVTYKLDDVVDVVLVVNYEEKAKKLCKKRQRFDVVDVLWLERVIKEGNLLEYETEEVYCLGNNIKNCLSDNMDRYGDSYTKETTTESLNRSFEIMQNLSEEPLYGSLIKNPSKKNYQEFVAYFDRYIIVCDTNSEIIYNCLEDELEFRYYSGKVCQDINWETNLIIYSGIGNRLEYLKGYLQRLGRNDIKIKPNTFLYHEKQ